VSRAIRERVRKKLVMPDLVGLHYRDAQIMLTNLGFAEGTLRFVESYEDVDHIVNQHPMKGQLVDSTTEVLLSVAKQSYLRFLPQVFQVDAGLGNAFLREYLWIFQHTLESLTSHLDDGHRYYDPRETPQHFLNWLASWVALTLDVDWPDVKKRKMIRAAAEMYRYRGTKRAMREVLEIFLGKRPSIQENAWPYAGFRIGISSTVAEDTIILPPIQLDHCFMVHIPVASDEITEEMVVKVHNIIKMEKPAHATYFLQFKTEEDKARPQAFFQIGVSALGVADLRYDEDEEEPLTEPVMPAAEKPARPEPVPVKKPAKAKETKAKKEKKEKKETKAKAAPKAKAAKAKPKAKAKKKGSPKPKKTK